VTSLTMLDPQSSDMHNTTVNDASSSSGVSSSQQAVNFISRWRFM